MTCSFSTPKLNFSISILQVGKNASSVESGDFTNDGFPDVIVANAGDSSVTLLHGSQNGISGADSKSFFAGHFPNDLDCADFNGDGNLDVLIANHERKFMTLLFGDGAGRLGESLNSTIHADVSPHVHGIASADFNRDGFLDCMTDSWETDEIMVLSGTKEGLFTTPARYNVGDHPYQRARVFDFNKDGAADIVTTNLESGDFTILLNDGKGKFKQGGSFTHQCGDAPFGVAIGDLNSDGNADLAIVNSVSLSNRRGKDNLVLFLGDGTGKFTSKESHIFATGTGPSRVAIGDVNGDGQLDIAVTNYRDNTVSVYLFSKELIPEIYILKTGRYPDGVAISDTDGDGKSETYVGNSGENTISVFKLVE